MSETPIEHPGVRFPPPLLYVGSLGLAAILHRVWPVPLWPGPRPVALLILAYLLLGVGLVWMQWGLITFRRARTAIFPHYPASRLVMTGPYRFGRNPMYLGMTAVYWGVGLWINTFWALVLFPVVIFLLLRHVIHREERYLASAFGQEYAEYCRVVPRWLTARPIPRRP